MHEHVAGVGAGSGAEWCGHPSPGGTGSSSISTSTSISSIGSIGSISISGSSSSSGSGPSRGVATAATALVAGCVRVRYDGRHRSAASG